MGQACLSNSLKRLASLLTMFALPAIVFAQQNPAASSVAAQLPVALAANFTPPPLGYFSMATVLQATHPRQAAKHEPEPALKPMKRARIDPSMVGYLDDATVQSEVRLRFDAGFNDPRPDAAEYFYAGSNTPAGATDAVQRTLNFQQLYFTGEYAALPRLSVSVTVPYRWIEPFFISAPGKSPDLFSGGGISDVQAGLKFAAFHSPSTDLALQFLAQFPTGNGANGFGTNHYSIEPALLLYHQFTSRAAIEAEASDAHPIGGTIYQNPPAPPQNFSGDVAMYGIGPSYRLIEHNRYCLAPVLELVAWHIFGGLKTGPDNQVQSAAGTNIFNAKLGARLDFSGGNSIYAGYGRALTSDILYRNLFRIEFRHNF